MQAESHIVTKHNITNQEEIRFADEGLIQECKSKIYKWSNSGTVHITSTFSAKLPSAKSKTAKTPLQFFQLFFDDCVLYQILMETIRYSIKKTKI